MKPIIVKTTDGKNIDMTLSDFNKLIEEVYKEAFDEGYKEGKRTNYTLYYPLTYNPPTIHWDSPLTNPYEITCDTNTNVKTGTELTINSIGEVITK